MGHPINTPIGILPAEEGMAKRFLQKHEVSSEPGCQIAITLIVWQIFTKLSVLYSAYTSTNVSKVVHKY